MDIYKNILIKIIRERILIYVQVNTGQLHMRGSRGGFQSDPDIPSGVSSGKSNPIPFTY